MPAITLSPSRPNVTLTGLTNAYGTIGSYVVNYLSGPYGQSAPVEAAIFGTQNTNFSVLNAGTILSNGESELDAGIVLGGIGTVKNTGTIIAPSGVFILGTSAGAYAANTGTILATYGDGIDMLGAGSANNSGYISATAVGIFDAGGLVDNVGTIIVSQYDGIDMLGPGAVTNAGYISAAASGIFDTGGPVENDGTIIAGRVGIKAGTAINAGTIISGYGILAYGHFTNTSGALLSAPGGNGVYALMFSAVYNAGTIRASTGLDTTSESSFYNTGIVTASNAGIYQRFNPDIYANGFSYITNYQGGVIAGTSFGIQIKFGDAYIYNAGLIAGGTAVSDYGVIINHGTIKGGGIGVAIYFTLTNTGKITGATGVMGRGQNPQIINAGKIIGHTGIHLSGGGITNTGLIQGRVRDGINLTAQQHHGRAPGQIYNAATGTITGADAGIAAAAGGTIINSGKITSTSGDGVDLASQSLLFNRQETLSSRNATISGARYGVSLAGAGYLYNNAGFITGGSAAIYMAGLTHRATTGDSGAYLYNYAPVAGGQYGVLSRAGTVNIFEYGNATISGQTAILAADAYLNIAYGYDNGTAPAFIHGGAAGIVLTRGGTILNRGFISATGTAIYAGAGGATILDRLGQIDGAEGIVLAGAGYVDAGVVQGASIGIDLKSGGTIVNSSFIYAPDAITISGGGTVINKAFAAIAGDVLFGTGANRLVLDPGSKIEGVYVAAGIRGAATVDLSGGILELAAATGTLGVVFAVDEGGASAITIDKSANWTFAAYESFAASAPITNDGAIRQISGPGATIAAAITGQGDIDIEKGTISLDGAVGAGQTVKFNSFAAELALGDPTGFSATIQNFSALDTIDLTGITLSDVQGLSFSAGILTLDETAGTLTFTFANPSRFAHETFSAFALGAGTGIILSPAKLSNGPAWLGDNPTPSATNTANLITLQT